MGRWKQGRGGPIESVKTVADPRARLCFDATTAGVSIQFEKPVWQGCSWTRHSTIRDTATQQSVHF